MNTLQNQVTEQGKTLSAQGDSLTQLSNSLSQTAADIDASGKMPGNLIVNGSFEAARRALPAGAVPRRWPIYRFRTRVTRR